MMPSPSADSVFIVDASRTIRELVAHMVRQCGVTPFSFQTSSQCLYELKARQPAVILIELNSVPMRGEAFCRLIKDQPDFARTPVVLMAAGHAPEPIMRFEEAGADDILTKPIRKAQLEAKIAAIREVNQDRAAQFERRCSRKVLFVSNDAAFREMFGNLLEHAGLRLMYADGEKAATSILQQHGELIDAVVVDLVPPWSHALEFLRTTREGNQSGRKPILALCGPTPLGAVEQELIQLIGPNLISRQSVPFELLVSKVNKLLGRLTLNMRVAKRVPFFSVVEFRPISGGEWQSGYSSDLSVGGMCLRTLTPMAPGTALEVKVNFTGKMQQLCTGLVAWSNPFLRTTPLSYPIGMGIHLTGATAEQLDQITGIVRAAGRAA